MSYWRFAAMIVTSTIVMFGLMYLNTYLVSHVFFSETRAYMAILMGAVMAVIMLAFMLSMYSNKAINAMIFAVSIVVFGLTLWLVRSQATVGDLSFMRAMIPHHSIAIMTSSRANLSDPRVQDLAENIADAQNKEIAEMRFLIHSIEAEGDEAPEAGVEQAQLVSLKEALSTPVIPRLDAEPMSRDDIALQFGDQPTCRFSYTSDSRPVFATDGNTGLLKISADLVAVDATADGYGADDLSLRISDAEGHTIDMNDDELRAAVMTLAIAPELRSGYEGWWSCN